MSKFLLFLVDFTRFVGIRYLICFVFMILVVYLIRCYSYNRNNIIYSFLNDKSIKDLLEKNKSFVPLRNEYIDWHDYKQIEKDYHRRGPGERGRPVKEIDNRGVSVIMDGFYAYRVNIITSEKISLNRSLPDVRHPDCKKKLYLESLPTVSIIIPIRYEHFTTLLRTVQSIINRSPQQLIKEIILVSEVITDKHYKERLEKYISNYAPLIRCVENFSILGAKLQGAKEAQGDILLFLNPHCEVNVNWLPPLLQPIALDYHTVTCPHIDQIDSDTFQYKKQMPYHGRFDEKPIFIKSPLSERIANKLPEPYKTPIIYPEVYAISRLFFWELGGYDPDLFIWGGENVDMSFKIWQCGGTMLTVPCSRIGHVDSKTRMNMNDLWIAKYALKYPNGHMFATDYSTPKPNGIHQRLNCKPFFSILAQMQTGFLVDDF